MKFSVKYSKFDAGYRLLSNDIPILTDGYKTEGYIDFTVEKSQAKAFDQIYSCPIQDMPDFINLFCFPLGWTSYGFTITNIRKAHNCLTINYSTEQCNSDDNHHPNFAFSKLIFIKAVVKKVNSLKQAKIIGEYRNEDSVELALTIPIKNQRQTIRKMIGKTDMKLWYILTSINIQLSIKMLTCSVLQLVAISKRLTPKHNILTNNKRLQDLIKGTLNVN